MIEFAYIMIFRTAIYAHYNGFLECHYSYISREIVQTVIVPCDDVCDKH